MHSTWRQKFLPFFFLSFFSLSLTGLTLICGAPFLRAFQRLYGWRVFFYFYALVSFLLLWLYPLWGFIFLILWCALSFFFFFYKSQKVKDFLRASLLSIGLCFLFLFLFLWVASWNTGELLYPLQAGIESLLEGVKPLKESSLENLNPQKVVLQLPLLFYLILLLSFFFSVCLEHHLHLFLGSPSEVIEGATQQFLDLKRYKLPDFFMWITLTAFLLTFFFKKSSILGPLFFNGAGMLAGLYFFQGLAVLECLFTGFLGLRGLWKALVYMLLFIYLNVIVVFVGFADYWLDFRLRIRKISIKS